jgi:phosphate transport system permease protein
MVEAVGEVSGLKPLKSSSRFLRKFVNQWVKASSSGAALLGIVFLVWILFEVIARGVARINLGFFLDLPAPPGAVGGGLGNAILGTLYITVLAVIFGVPIGLFTGVYLSEFGRSNRFADAVRFFINMMMGVPSIIIGLFVYTLLVAPIGGFSGYAGGVALALMIMPIVARTTEDMLTLVPNTLRESAMALGAPRWRLTLGVLFPAAKAGMITGVLLAIARVSGETAPLLFTALNSPYWITSLAKPTANLTVTIFNFAMSPYPDWQALAWGASLLITAAVLFVTIATRFLLRGKKS